VDAVPGASGGDPPQLLDIDVNQLAGTGALIAVGRLRWLQPREFAQTDALKHRRDRGGRHAQAERDLGAGHAQPAQRGNHRHQLL
jgi:hypothetical protein